MDNLWAFLVSPLGALVVAIAWKLVSRKMGKKWLKTLRIVCRGLEDIEQVHDFVKEKDQEKFDRFIKKLKKRIDHRLIAEGGDKKNVDKALDGMGLLNKSGNAD